LVLEPGDHRERGRYINSIGLVLVGGMFIGTLFTLFIIPSIYMLIARDHGKDREREAVVAAAEVS
jgi:multidrug efflux pump